ncbi:MAG: hypothetical protein RIT81_37070 [Deltaproteobacteria bacterium]
MKRLLPLALILAACGEPEVHVRFDVPAAYRPFVDDTSLAIYLPPAGAPFTCDDLAFAQIDDDLVRASRVASIAERELEIAPLADIDRVAPKVFVAEGVDALGQRLVVGCAEVGEIGSDTEVAIRGRPVTRTTTIASSIQQTLGDALTAPVVVTIVDFLGQPLPGADVRWQVVGASGEGPIGRGTSDGEGRVSIDAQLPTRAGPFVLDVRVRWAEGDAAAIPGFVVPPPTIDAIEGRVFDVRAGRIGPNGEPGFVALKDGDLPRTRRVVFVYQVPGGALQMRTSQAINGTVAALGLLSPTTGRDRPVVITESEWYEFTTDGAPLFSTAYEPPPGALGAAPLAIHEAGPCTDDADGPYVIVSYDAPNAAIFDATGMQRGEFGGRLDTISAGCVSDEKGGLVRMLVLNQQNIGLVVAAELTPQQYALREWYAIASGMSFAPSINGSERLLLGTQLSVNDFVVSRLKIERTGPGAFELVMAGLDSPPAPPVRNRGGEVDGDGTLDVISLFTRPRVDAFEPPRYAVWGVLGREARGRRVAGDFDLPMPELVDPELLLVDIDQDGADDIVIVERSASGVLVGDARVEIYSMGTKD